MANMKNDNMDALGVLLSLGLMGAMLGSDGDKMKHPFIQTAEKEAKDRLQSLDSQQSKPTAIEGAKAAKELYDSYVKVGFTQDQAFELLKTALSTGIRK